MTVVPISEVTISVDSLWDCIYAARDCQKYWRRVRAETLSGVDTRYNIEEVQSHFQDAKELINYLESLAPAETW